MAACHSGHARLATVWMQDADLARAAQDGTTCLHAAARGGHSGLVQQLLRRGADPAARDRNGKRALELARAAKHAQTVETLLPVTPVLPPAPRPPAINLFLIALGLALAVGGAFIINGM